MLTFSLSLMSVCDIAGRVSWKQLILRNYNKSQTYSFRLILYYQAKQIHDERNYTIKICNNSENVNDYRAMECMLRAMFENSAHRDHGRNLV